jgi:hypothetical protein
VAFAALAVHLWLPLLALAIVCTQAITWLSGAVRFMQWFIKQGQVHPYEAVGYVAAPLVFIIAAGIQYRTVLISILGRALS